MLTAFTTPGRRSRWVADNAGACYNLCLQDPWHRGAVCGCGDARPPAEAHYLHTSNSCRDQEQQSAVQDACRVHSSQHQPREQEQQQQQQAHKSLYVFNVEGRRWNAPLLLGLLDRFETLYANVGFFQPIAGMPFPGSATGLPRHIELLHSVFSLRGDPQAMLGVSRQDTLEALATKRQDELFDRIYACFEALQAAHDLLLIEGTHEDGPVGVPGDRLELNAQLAASLGAPVLMALDAHPGQSAEAVARSATIARNTVANRGADVLGLLVNQLPPDAPGRLLREVRDALEPGGLRVFGGLPRDGVLQGVHLDAVAAALGTRFIAGQQDLLDASAAEVVVGAGSFTDMLRDVEAAEGRPLVVAPATRPDIVLGVGAAQAAGGGPHPAGVLVTDAKQLDARVRKIMESGELGSVFRAPVLMTDAPLRATLQRLDAMDGSDVLPSSAAKVERAKLLFERHVDGAALAQALDAPPATERQTPKAFLHTLQRRCSEQRQRIVLPEGSEPRVLRAAAEVSRRGLADITLLGNAHAIQDEAGKLGVDISRCAIEDPATSQRLDKYVDLLCEARKHKGTTPEMARDMLEDVNYWGTMAVAAGDADGMVSGAVHTTAATIRPGLQVLRSKAVPLVSSVFFMLLPDKVLVYGDCAVNVSPSAEDLANIAIASADTAAAFGVRPPRAALLSYSTGASGSGAEVEKVKEAVAQVRERRPDILVEGPIQYDAAVDPGIAAIKIKGESEVAGKANVLIFPDLNTGNNTYKAVQQSTGALALGPIMQGLRLPVNDLSRGCTVNDIVNTCVCTAVQALAAKG